MAKVILMQLGLTVILALLFWVTGGLVTGYSVLLGGLTCIIPNAFLALRLALVTGDFEAKALVRAAYIGELGKLALTVILFTMVFLIVQPLEAGALFVGFIATQLVTFLGFLVRDKKTDG